MGWCMVGGVLTPRALGVPSCRSPEGVSGWAWRGQRGGGFGEGVGAGLLPSGSCERLGTGRGGRAPMSTSPPRRGSDPQDAPEGHTLALGSVRPSPPSRRDLSLGSRGCAGKRGPPPAPRSHPVA